MSKIIIHYFTGTGNTAHSVKLMSERLQNAGHKVKIWQVRKGVLPPVEVFDYHIIAFPVLSWASPVIMQRYIRKMPKGLGAKTAILAVNGAIIYKGELVKGYTGQAIEELEKILKRKKYDVFLTGNASFPDNWTQVTNPSSKQDVEVIFPLGEAEVHVFIEKFLAEKRELFRCGFFNWLCSYFISVLFGIIGRRALGKFYIADERCTGCAICVRSCPAQTIKMEHKKPYWGASCEDCNRCINICPEQAVQVSVPAFILQSAINLILIIWAIRAIQTYIPEWFQINQLLLIGLEIIIIVSAYIILLWISFVPIDAFLRRLLRLKGVRHFFSLSYTQKYRRYKAPGFNPIQKDV
jgi:NAD-dependent dihydropyrimidine dehydrogenase PreA subunit/flavodoxin